MMTTKRRAAPDPEWVQMYRQGVTTPKVAAGAGTAESTVRYHLSRAVKADPGLRDAHKKALGPVNRKTSAGIRNLNDVLALYEAEGRPPTTGGKTTRERSLGAWIHRCQQEAAAGTLSPVYREGLQAIPGWDSVQSLKAKHDARWDQRFAELAGYRAAGNDWPRHKGPGSDQERVLGTWLHVQRISRHEGKLYPEREARLDASLPGWREGRARSGGRSSNAATKLP